MKLDGPAEEQKQRPALEIFHDAIVRNAYRMAILRQIAKSFFGMHLTIREAVSRLSWEPDHVSLERILEIVRNDDVVLTLEELEHLKSCPDCFNRWAECIRNMPPPETTR